MDYIAQYYKNRTIQLQEELEQLTETYNYRLNEAGGWLGAIGRAFGIADDAVPNTPIRPRTPVIAGTAEAAPVLTAAQRQALLARQQAAAALAARIFARDVKLAMQTVVNHLMDIPPENWGNFAGGLSAAERAAYNRLFVHSRNPALNGIRSGNIPGHGVCPQRLLFYNGQYRVMWWNDATERWYFAGKGVTTEFGSTGSTGYVNPPGVTPNKPLAAANLDTDIDPNFINNEIATNTGSSTGSGLGSVAALYMSYDPRAVSRKINYITENYYRN